MYKPAVVFFFFFGKILLRGGVMAAREALNLKMQVRFLNPQPVLFLGGVSYVYD